MLPCRGACDFAQAQALVFRQTARAPPLLTFYKAADCRYSAGRGKLSLRRFLSAADSARLVLQRAHVKAPGPEAARHFHDC